MLTKDQLDKVFNLLKKYFCLENTIEISFELNLSDLNINYIKTLQSFQINRFSIGVQTTSKLLNKFLNRNFSICEQALHFLHQNNLNFSFDFIYGLPFQTKSDILNDLKFIKNHKPQHISWYSYVKKENSPLGKWYEINQHISSSYFTLIASSLKSLKYHQYEVSSFSKNSRVKCFHNLCYWNYESYIGLGPSAHSLIVDGEHNSKIIINQAKINWNRTIKNLSKHQFFQNYILMNLRKKSGMRQQPNQNFATANLMRTKLLSMLETSKKASLVKITKNTIALKNINLANEFFVEII